MPYKLITTTETEKDIDTNLENYTKISNELANKFLDEVIATRHYLHNNPLKMQVRYDDVRIAFLDTFSYGLHYQIESNTITVIGLFATAQSPANWKSRT